MPDVSRTHVTLVAKVVYARNFGARAPWHRAHAGDKFVCEATARRVLEASQELLIADGRVSDRALDAGCAALFDHRLSGGGVTRFRWFGPEDDPTVVGPTDVERVAYQNRVRQMLEAVLPHLIAEDQS